jgi:hypothetical protein
VYSGVLVSGGMGGDGANSDEGVMRMVFFQTLFNDGHK